MSPDASIRRRLGLAVTGTRRWAQTPDVPTLTEAGVPGFERYNWFGLLAPAGTPPAVIGALNKEVVAIMQEASIRTWLQSQGAEAMSSSPEEFAAYIRRDVAKWARVVKETGITPE